MILYEIDGNNIVYDGYFIVKTILNLFFSIFKKKSGIIYYKLEMDSVELASPKELCKRVVKFLVLGFVVAVSALLIQRKLKAEEVVMLGLIASATFALLEMYAPSIAPHAHQGAGLGIGLSMVGFPGK